MWPATKHSALFFFVGSLASIFMLATSLSSMQLHVGTPFPGSETPVNGSQQIATLPPGKTYSFQLTQGIFALLFLILMIYVPARLMALASIKRILGLVIILVMLFVFLSLLPPITPGRPSSLGEESSELSISRSDEYPVSPLGKPPAAFTWMVLIGLGVGVSILGIGILKRRSAATVAKDQLQQEVMMAVDALHAGKAFKDVIIQCYMRMVHVLQDEEGMERRGHMTVREFEALLESRGIPPSPVHQLTYLFEKVRYGKQPASADDELLGIECLNQIIRFCKREKE